MPLPALLRYDIWLAWRHLRAAFSKPGDVAIAVIGIPLLLAVLVKATENFVTRLVQMPAPIAGAVALAIALLSADAATARLTWHRTGSVMAAKAYPGASMIYLATLLAPVFALCAWSSLLAVSGEAPLHGIWMVSGLSFGLLSASCLAGYRNMAKPFPASLPIVMAVGARLALMPRTGVHVSWTLWQEKAVRAE